MKIRQFETEELAAYLCNIQTDDSVAIASALFDRYHIDIDNLHKLLQDLMDCTALAVSPITNDAFVGFSKPGEWILKKKANPAFIGSMITWISEGKGVPEIGQGWQKVITKGGAPECTLAILNPEDKITLKKRASK
ncbi:hypothetical protein DN752_17925 [Echinicola strongylocentroti]|uniref:Uncharacterized protein n=1 Tax=Echinicola strongylocentroti TaxID=1795355 RepID=A0A2Z4IM99_9BACT|nr:hypothetical protein [Echinicola strongylocentroti]AWW31859.1 hypothetical protein DN752_17925 [Echinicola strongylocentroti]